ncbi:hypothetical protein [Massilibacteroides sp.]|uniref:hypothetical protein n=1 Tax=Massilibacteroides sp. TaxID=2034766 RepID=UPI002620E05E|nr:hypothetical protein [Massilibacteroides sp.]MDD4516878.1 hypothetical protein [Massilibacteroides sp.]
MAQTVSNDALWEKLLEMDKKLTELTTGLNSEQLKQRDGVISSYSQDEILASIDDKLQRIGFSNDSHFAANKQNVTLLAEYNTKILNIVARIRKQQRESIESREEDKTVYFTLWFLNIRKTSFIIAILGVLVIILTLFCMKQQNDYSILINELHKHIKRQ